MPAVVTQPVSAQVSAVVSSRGKNADCTSRRRDLLQPCYSPTDASCCSVAAPTAALWLHVTPWSPLQLLQSVVPPQLTICSSAP